MLARRPRACHGATVVEFALVLPVFLLFLFGLVEIGRAMMTASLLTEAARTGCRAGILTTADNKAIVAAVKAKTSALRLESPAISVQVNGKEGDVAAAAARDEITVAVSVVYADVTWLPFARWIRGRISGQYSLPRE